MARFVRHQWHKGSAWLVGLSIVVGVGATSPFPASAIPLDLILHGIQLLQLSRVSPQQEVQIGQDIHQQVLRNYRLSRDSRLNANVNRVGQRVASVSDCKQFPFHFYVVESPDINAFSTTGGYVYVNTGLIQATDNEAQLAGVLGHEIGHICNNDLINKMKESQVAGAVASAAGLDRSTVANLGYQLAFELPNSRQDEFNADSKGLTQILQQSQ